MFKIRLLILLLINIFILSCSLKNQDDKATIHKYSLAYIGGGYSGLTLMHYFDAHLKSSGLYDQNSNLEIRANINHSENLYITNIDNTSDRENITSELKVNIFHKVKNCITYSYSNNISQFYIFASAEKYLSNSKASKSIEDSNTEALVQNFINKIQHLNNECA